MSKSLGEQVIVVSMFLYFIFLCQLYVAARDGRKEGVADLLRRGGVNINWQDPVSEIFIQNK